MAIVLEKVTGAFTAEFMKRKYTRIDIHGVIDAEMSKRVVKQIDDAVRVLNESGKVIFIFLHCTGGSLYEAFRIIDAMNRAKKYYTVATVVNSIAFSAAVLVFQSADDGYRFIADDAQLMIHKAVLQDMHPRNDVQRAHDVEHVRKLQSRLELLLTAIYLKNKSLLMKKFLHDLSVNQTQEENVEWFLHADDIMQFGLADHREVPDFLHDFQYQGKIVLRNKTMVIQDKNFQIERGRGVAP